MIRIYYYIFMMIVLTISGCSNAPNEPNEPTQSQNVDPTPMRQEGLLPFAISLNSSETDDGVTITLDIDFKAPLNQTTILELQPGNQTEVLGIGLKEELPPLTEPAHVTKTFQLKGEKPTLKVTLSIKDAHFGAGVQAVYPKNSQHKAVRMDNPAETPLPAPIDVEGMNVDSGIEVHP